MPGCPVHVGEADLRLPGHLAVAGLAAQLRDDLVDLAQAGGADGLAVGDAAAVGVDRQPPPISVSPAGDHRFLLAVLAEAALGHVHDLGAALGVLELRDVDVVGADAGLLEGRRGRVGADAGRVARTLDRRAEHLERAEAPGARD